MSSDIARKIVGRLGVWSWVDTLTAAEAREYAKRIEELGYGSLWLPEAVGRDPFATIVDLARSTTKLGFATGIANIYARDPMTMNTLRLTVGDLTEGRFLLGIGVSHKHLVSGIRGHEYKKPVATMRNYVEAMAKATFLAPKPEVDVPIVLAALRQNMTKLAGSATAGSHPYLTPPEHPQRAREILGDGPLLAPEQMVILEENPDTARALARETLKMYVRAPNYQKSLLWLGFEDKDFEGGEASDRLVDALVAWGSADKIREHIEKHFQAGADHVCIQPLNPRGPKPDMDALEALAPGA